MHLFLAIICYLAALRTTSAACYNTRNGVLPGSEYTPCNGAAGSTSMCCGANRGDVCLPNGLCQYASTTKSTGRVDTSYWREGCSDKNWDSTHCLKGICASSSDIDGSGDAEMTPCDGTATSAKWCCGAKNKACCGTGKEIVLAAVLGGAVAKASSASSPAAVVVSTPTTTPIPAPVVNNVQTPTTAAPDQPTAVVVQNQDTTSPQPATSIPDQQYNSLAPNPSSSPEAQSVAQPLGQPPSTTTPYADMNTALPYQSTSQLKTLIHTTGGKASAIQTSTSGIAISESSAPADNKNTAGLNSGLSAAAKAGIGIGIAILVLTTVSVVVYMYAVRPSGTWRSRHDVQEIVQYKPPVR